MYQRARLLGSFLSLTAFAVLTPAASAQFGRVHPSYSPHYGCFGYCPGPITPVQPIRPQYYGCFGYCNGPINGQHHYATCFGYCPSPTPVYNYPSITIYPSPTETPAPIYSGNSYFESPSPVAKPPEKFEGKTVDDWGKLLKSDSARERGTAAAALSHFGAAAKPYVGDLINLLKDPDANVRVQSTETLARLGKNATDALQKALLNDNKMVRMGAMLALGHMGEVAIGVLQPLKDALKDQEADVRGHAAQAIWRITDKPDDAVPVLAELAKSGDGHVKQGALSVLSQMGVDAKKSSASIKEALQSKDAATRVSAATAFWNIDPKDPAIVKTLTEALADKDADVQADAARVLAHMGESAKEAIPALGKALLDPDPQVNYEASVALSWQGKAAVAVLRRGLESESALIRRHAALALGEIGPDAKAAVPELLALLKDKDETVKTFAADAIKKIDPEAAKKAGIP